MKVCFSFRCNDLRSGYKFLLIVSQAIPVCLKKVSGFCKTFKVDPVARLLKTEVPDGDLCALGP